MKKLKTVIIVFFLIHTSFLIALPQFFDDTESELLIKNIISEMDDTDLLGQVMILGYYGLDPSDEILEWISTKRIGGVKIFGWNVSNLERLGKSITLMQKTASENPLGIPLFIATDQEGGWVRHIKGNTSITPGNLSIGATAMPVDAYKTGRYIGLELKTIGINMNFAPTVDIYTNPDADVIGPRSFSSDPVMTATLSTSFFEGQDSTAVISTAKHFPGHGSASGDSHGMLPEVNADFQTLWNRELLPYRFLIKRGVPAIMSGHISFPKITEDNIPASGSKYFLTDVLRKQLGFEGIIITDDMVMRGAKISTKGIEESCYNALNAGNDIIMISRSSSTYQIIWDYLYKKLQDDKDFKENITTSVRRILKTKFTYLKRDDAVSLYPDIDKITEDIPNSMGNDFFLDQAFRSVSILRGEKLPISIEDNSTVLLAGPYRVFLAEGKKQIASASTYYFPFIPEQESEKNFLADFKSEVQNYDRVIFCLANDFSLAMLKTLEDTNVKVTVISVLTPVLIQELSWINSAVAVYGTGYESFMAGFSAILGEYQPTGIVPVENMQNVGKN
ncbi:MAG: glycoside hydrolase family 3 protein [Spirochaetia bacterium]|jgi:beta-N-acetylhexosaminidase|nr:glycoside hydrolase family 3 protein [Spirochaetia bacterium]